MNRNLELRWAEPGDLDEIQAFLASTFGPDSVQASSGRCRWLFFENPLGLHVTLCLSSGTIVAVCGHLPQYVTVGREEILAGFGVDFMVGPAWRRQGIGRRFLEMRLERFRLCLSIGQSNEMGALYRSLGARDLGPMHLGIFRRRPSLGLHPRMVARDLAAWATGLSGPRPPAGTTVQPRGFGHLSPAHADWFTWRYGPASVYGDYFGLALDHPGHGPALAVCRSAPGHDLAVEIQCPAAGRAEYLAALGRTGPKVETRILFTGEALAKDCRSAGFLVRPHGARVIGMTRDHSLRESLTTGAIDLTAGASDGDLVRPLPACN